ncbi:hypothetical protein KP509_22G006100 [Ceratopteris richardii]|nr:hypothetical protein KP509_22G006100 [Ceratopteris richardii]
MIAGYAEHGHVQSALELFHQWQENDFMPNISSWNSVIRACALSNLNEDALWYFNQMMQEGYLPEDITFATVLSACTSLRAQNQGKFLHVSLLEKGLASDVFLGNTLINLYAKCGNFKQANVVFDRLPERDCVTWNALISGHSLHGNCTEALKLFHDMQKSGYHPDLVTWNALLTGQVQHGHAEEALQLFEAMEGQGPKPDTVTFLNVLKACSSMASLKKGKLFHTYMLESVTIIDLSVCNALIDMYAKCGSLEDACSVFVALPKRDAVTWNSMIAANFKHNQNMKAFAYLKDMQLEGFQPDEVTFLCVLSAYRQESAIDPSALQFICTHMAGGISLSQEQYSSIVDLLGSKGFLQAAGKMLTKEFMKDDLQAWASLLRHCKMFGNVHLGRQCFDHIQSLDDQYTTCYELMSALYTDMGMWEDAHQIRSMQSCAEGCKKSFM